MLVFVQQYQPMHKSAIDTVFRYIGEERVFVNLNVATLVAIRTVITPIVIYQQLVRRKIRHVMVMIDVVEVQLLKDVVVHREPLTTVENVYLMKVKISYLVQAQAQLQPQHLQLLFQPAVLLLPRHLLPLQV